MAIIRALEESNGFRSRDIVESIENQDTETRGIHSTGGIVVYSVFEIQMPVDNGLKPYVNLTCEVNYDDKEDFSNKFKTLVTSRNKADAVVFSTNTLSILGLKELLKLGITIPYDLAVFCFDESESYDLFYCRVSFVKQPMKEIGEKAVKILLDHLSNPDKMKNSKEVLATQLIIGESSRRLNGK